MHKITPSNPDLSDQDKMALDLCQAAMLEVKFFWPAATLALFFDKHFQAYRINITGLPGGGQWAFHFVLYDVGDPETWTKMIAAQIILATLGQPIYTN